MKLVWGVLIGLCFLRVFVTDAFAIADKDGPKIGDVPPPLTLSKMIQGSPPSEINWDKLKGR
jgi:hypothetical protein